MNLAKLLPPFVAIPAQEFLMGTPADELGMLAKHYGGTRESYREEAPRHTVTLPAFLIARIPVTNALYGQYVAATGAVPPMNWRSSQPPAELLDHPVVDINWTETVDFCAWLTATITEPVQVAGSAALPAGRPEFRLPTEAEWEHAARGTDGRLFPWGEQFATACANTREADIHHTTPVGQYHEGVSPYGVLDMAGNVWEWTASLDGLYPYAPHNGRERAGAEGRRIARGGCYANPQGFARCACRFRFAPDVRNPFLGFRLAFTPV
jgi:formylglycine-generating enzyme required for sulfatase activity